jgi:hypothetical protein
MRQPLPRRTIRRMMVGIAIAGIALAVAKSFFIDNRPRDLLFAAISALEGHSTVYAPGYSESGFRSLRAGMTARQVEEILGPPLVISQWFDPPPGRPTVPGEGTPGVVWSYTRPRKARGNYWLRWVFFRDGLVHGTETTYWVD